ICGEMFDFLCQLTRHKAAHVVMPSQKDTMNVSALAEEKSLNEQPSMNENMDEPTERNIVNDNLDSMEDDMIGEEREDEETSLKEPESESGKRIENYPCNICQREFDTKAGLSGHMALHSRNKRRRWLKKGNMGPKFTCDRCPYYCASTTALAIHKCTHTGERPHKCPHCSYRFASSSFLKNHIRLVHGLKQYACPLCEEKFDRLSQLTIHKRNHYKIFPAQNHHSTINKKSSETVIVKENGRSSRNAPRPLRYTDINVNDNTSKKTEKGAPSEEYPCDLCSRVFERKRSLINHCNSVHYDKTSLLSTKSLN
ncbi:hypothetical protein PENTCL1PPCAC_12498, partial [Pristionchus entomophagus]